MPSPTQRTNYAADIALLTSQYQKARPFTPFELGPVFWYRALQGLAAPSNNVQAWTDYFGSVALDTIGTPLAIASDAAFGNATSVKFLSTSMQSPTVTTPATSTTALTIVTVGAGDDDSQPGLTVYDANLIGSSWTVTPSASGTRTGIRLVELLVFGSTLTAFQRGQLQTYYNTAYGVGLV